MRTTLLVIAALAAVAVLPGPASAATCSQFANQAQAQAAANTVDADNDGVYCESLPCPCSTGNGNTPPPPAAAPPPEDVIAPPPPVAVSPPPPPSGADAPAPPPPPTASVSSAITVVTRDYYVSRIGSFLPTRNPRLSAAIRAFGQPSSRKLTRRTCRVEWRRLRLRITFENFGAARPKETTCTPSVGRAQSFVARSPRFRTVNDLRVGQPTSAIRAKHPAAEFQPAGFWAVVLARFPFGDGAAPRPVLNALVSGGRVIALTGYIGGAGE